MFDQAGCSHFRYKTSLKQFERSFQSFFLQEHDFVRVWNNVDIFQHSLTSRHL